METHCRILILTLPGYERKQEWTGDDSPYEFFLTLVIVKILTIFQIDIITAYEFPTAKNVIIPTMLRLVLTWS